MQFSSVFRHKNAIILWSAALFLSLNSCFSLLGQSDPSHQVELIEDKIRVASELFRRSANKLGLEEFILPELEAITKRVKDISKLDKVGRLAQLSELFRDTRGLARTIQFEEDDQLRLSGPQVTDQWLKICASRVATVDVIYLNGTSITDSGLKHLSNLKHLETLVLDSPGITGSGLKGFLSPKLSYVNLIGSGINDAGMETIGGLASIQTLYLDDSAISDEGLRHLRGLEQLVTLSLDGTEITNIGLSYLPPLPFLERLDLNRTSVSSLAGLKELKSLKQVNLDQTQMDDSGLEKLSEYPEKLEAISLENTNVTGSGLRYFSKMKSLSFLDLDGTAVSTKGLNYLKTLSELKYLYLKSTQVNSIAGIQGLQNLQTIDLRKTSVNDSGIACLGSFPKLEMLHLSNTPIRGHGLASLKDAKNLWYIDLNETQVADAGLAVLFELPVLERLELSSTRITDATLNRAARAGRLQYLDIFGTNITGFGIKRLSALKDLRELYIGGTAADDESIAALRGLTKIFHLDLQGTRITDAAIESIGNFKNLNSLNLAQTTITGASIEGLAGIEEIRTLNLEGTSVTDTAILKISNFLVRERNLNGSGGGFALLNNLILTDTEVSDAGIKDILKLNFLIELHLEGTNVSDKSISRIGKLQELRTLSLGRTKVTDEGLASISDLPKLRKLDLTDTEVSDKGIGELNHGLQELGLSYTKVSDYGLSTIEGMDSLQRLELAGTSVTDVALAKLAQVPTLESLNLAATTISDLGLEELSLLPVLSTLRLDGCNLTDRSAEILASFPSLEEVFLDDTRMSADSKALLIRRHPELRVQLDYPLAMEWDRLESTLSKGTLFNETALADLRNLPSVEALSFKDQEIGHQDLKMLQELPSLRILNLDNSTIDDALLQDLSKLSDLQVLRLSRTQVSDVGLEHLANLKNLEHLDLAETRLTGSGLKHLQGLTKLQSIRLSETQFDEDHAELLIGLKSLRRISLSNTPISDIGIEKLRMLSRLRYLDLYGTRVSDKALLSIGQMRSLSHLYLSKTAITDEGLANLQGLRELVELGLDGCKITNDGLAHLRGFKHLEVLRLNETLVSDPGVKTLVGIKPLRSLELNHTRVTNDSIQDLMRIEGLTEIALDGTKVNDGGLERLGTLNQLRYLSVKDSKVSRPAIESLQTLRPDLEVAFKRETKSYSRVGLVLTSLYCLIAVAICIYGAHRYQLIWLFLRTSDVRDAQEPLAKFEELPRVTVQLPMFNERLVAERAIAAACSLDYPKDRLQIQVLDDSTDASTEIARACCMQFQAEGIDITLHHRDSRDGYKSGALAAGLEHATGELVAIFDADFVPEPDFLKRTVHHFTDERVGVVQAEWRHLNRDESLLTQCQAIFLDGHLIVEQAVRSQTGRWFNFNGTAGLWRLSCIEQSGGWSNDTLTEDTDLSYRAQLAGWQFIFLPDVKVKAELPSTMSAFLSQQHRWTRGLLQCAIKLMPQILLSNSSMSVKAEAFFHLTAPILYGVMFLLTAIALPATFTALPLSDLRGPTAWILGTAVLLGGTLSAISYYALSQRQLGQPIGRTLLRLPVLMALGVGMSALNTRAALGALLGIQSPFIRTPKFGGQSKATSVSAESDPASRRFRYGLPQGVTELVVAGALFACLFLSLRSAFALVGSPFLLLFAIGFLWVGVARFVDSGQQAAVVKSKVPKSRLTGSAAVAFASAGLVLCIAAFLHANKSTEVTSRAAGFNLIYAGWSPRGAVVGAIERRQGDLRLDVDLNSKTDALEEGEISIDLTGPLASLGRSLSKAEKLEFDIRYPHHFTGELQAFVSDSNGKNQYGSIAFVERRDALRQRRVSIAPSMFTPAMGHTDPGFSTDRAIQRIGLKVSAQSDRVRGQGYRPFRGELSVSSIRVVRRAESEMPQVLPVAQDRIHKRQTASKEKFISSSGVDRPWPLGYAFSAPLSPEQIKVLEETYSEQGRHGFGFSRVYIGDYRTGLRFDELGQVSGIESHFLDYLDRHAEIANHHGVTVMFSLVDNTMLDGKGHDYPQFIANPADSNRFIQRVLRPIVERLSDRKVVWDLFNEPENATAVNLAEIQDFVDRSISELRAADQDAVLTIVSRNANDLIYWRGRGLDILSHNIFDERGIKSALNSEMAEQLDSPVWVAEMDPALATRETLESLRQAGYRGVGLWGWGTNDKYNWEREELSTISTPLASFNTKQ